MSPMRSKHMNKPGNMGCWSNLNYQGTAGFSPWFRFPALPFEVTQLLAPFVAREVPLFALRAERAAAKAAAAVRTAPGLPTRIPKMGRVSRKLLIKYVPDP